MGVVFIERGHETTTVNGKKETREVTNEEVINLATIRGVFSNNFQITGLAAGEARDLALLLRSGQLAAPLDPIEERAVGPSLGQDNIEKGVRALIIGMLAVFVFMAFYYRVFGLVADGVLLVERRPADRAPVDHARLAVAARHRRHHPDGGHGGRCQRTDLRAHP